MSWKKSLLIIFLFQIVVAVAIYLIINRVSQISYAQKAYGDYQGNFPLLTPLVIKNSNGWSGWDFRNGFRFFWQESKNPQELFLRVVEKNLVNFKYKRELSCGQRGIVFFRSRNKSYYLVVLAALDERLIWLDMLSKGSIDIGFNFLGEFLKTLSFKGQKISQANFEQEWLSFRQSIPFFEMQSVKTFFLLIFTIFIFVLFIIYIIFNYSGAKPAIADPLWELITPQVTIRERKIIGYRSFPACLIKKGNELLIFRFRKLYQSYNLFQAEPGAVWKADKLLLNKLTIIFPDHESAEKWKIYMPVA